MIRLLNYSSADGATNMAADETLVRSAAEGVASLRFYGWTKATVSLGYFQSHTVRSYHPLLTPLPWVRRPSGGATLVHHHELTYAFALPPGPWQHGEAWMPRMHRIITLALAQVGLTGQVESVGDTSVKHGDVLCFQQFTPGDLLSGGRKVVGSAQRKYHQALMQHGSALLEQSEYTPALPGIRELTGIALTAAQVQAAILEVFVADTGWVLNRGDWTEPELESIRNLAAEKYAAAAWNERR